jgi:hypothetical protein
MASLYTKQADHERFAASGASKLVDEKKNTYSRTMQKSAGNSDKKKAISNRYF